MRRSNRQLRPANLLLPPSPIALLVAFAAILIASPLPLNAQAAAAGAASVAQTFPTLADLRAHVTHEGVGDSLLFHHHYQEALDEYRKASSGSSDLWDKMGIAYQMLSDLKDAVRCYRKSLRLEPANELALNNLATVYELQAEYGKAEIMYRGALRLDPDSAKIAMNLGTVLMVQEKYSQGSEFYKRALSLDPNVFDQARGPVFESAVPLEQRGAMNYYKARQCAQAAMIDRAIEYLRKAMDEGFVTPGQLARDKSFVGLRDNPEFRRLVSGREK